MTIRHLRGGVAVIATAAEFASANPILLERQLSLETDTGVEKIGDGTTHYASLSALPGGSGGGSVSFGTWIYGDGSDGPLTLHDGDVLQPGLYSNITIEAGATITIGMGEGFTIIPTIYCSGTWTINGAVDLRGADAVDRNPAPGGNVGGEQGEPSQYAALTVIQFGAGGNGAAGLGTPAGRVNLLLTAPMIAASASGSPYASHGAGAGDGTNYGGAPGANGAAFALFARHLVHGADSSYLIKGGNGAPGGDDGTGVTGHGNCGGGGGGGGGWWLTVSDTIEGNTAVIGAGGTGGAGCGTGTNGSAGATGRGIHLLNRV